MTDVLTVPTHFGDISELSAGLADRVDEERLILYGPTAYEEGSTVGFAVLLVDGSAALEGVGRVTAAVDGGEERAPETRFDIVFDSLQLEGMSEVVYERIVLARESMMGDEPHTGEVSLEELEAEAAAAPQEDVADWTDGETAVANPEEMAALAESAAADGFDDAIAVDDSAVESVAPGSMPPEEAVADVAFDDGDVSFDAAVDDAAADDAASVDVASYEDVPPAGAQDSGEETMVGAVEDMVDIAPASDWDDGGDLAAEVDLATDDVAFDEPVDDAGFSMSSPSDLASQPPPSSLSSMSPPKDSLGPPPEDPPIAPSPELPPAPAGFQLAAFDGQLSRPTHPPTWQPYAEAPPEPSESTGFFLYAPNDLPVPATAPRPDLDPSLRVQPAPRPEGGAEAVDEVETGDMMAAPDPDWDTGDEPPQIPLPDADESDVAPAVEPDSFALGDEVSIQEPGEDEPGAEAQGEVYADEAGDVEALDHAVAIEEEPPAEPEASFDDASFDDDIAMDSEMTLDADDVAFEEDERV